jgi:hypothetical protein
MEMRMLSELKKNDEKEGESPEESHYNHMNPEGVFSEPKGEFPPLDLENENQGFDENCQKDRNDC